MKLLLIGSLFFMMIVSIGRAADTFFGEIRQDTRWTGDLVLSGDVKVLRGVILYIEPTSRIEIQANSDVNNLGDDPRKIELIVEGTLIASGEGHPRPIVFTSASREPQSNDWAGIIFKNFSTESILHNCIVEYAYNGVTIIGSAPKIKKSEVRFNYRSGISCEVWASPVIDGVIFSQNRYAGLHCELASTPLVQNCEFRQNRNGITVFSSSRPDLGRVPPKTGFSIGKNIFLDNRLYAIYNHTEQTVYAQNNIWKRYSDKEQKIKIFNLDGGRVIVQPVYRGILLPL